MVSVASFGNTSALSPTPSMSESMVSEESFGNASPLSPVPSLSVSMVSEESFGNTSALSPVPSPSLSVVSEGSSGNASSRSMVPSPSESMSTITALSGQTSVAPKSFPSFGVTETVHVSPTEVAVNGNIIISLYAGTTTPSFDQRISEFTSESPSGSLNV